MINKFYAEVKKYIKENYKFLICLILIIVVFNIDTGYSIYKPGGTINTSERVTGLYEHEGSFNMAYVGFMEGKLPFYLIGKLIPRWELVENKKIKADNETMDDSLTRDHLDYNNAISNAKIVAYKYANIPYKVVKDNYYVYYLAEEYNGSLKVGDKIISYDGINFEGFDEFKNYIKIKDLSKCKETLEEIDLRLDRNNIKSIIEVNLLKHTVLTIEEKLEEAKDILVSTYNMAKEFNLNEEASNLAIAIAKFYLDKKEDDLAKKYLDEGVEIFRKMGILQN